jgi:hypothetical protein
MLEWTGRGWEREGGTRGGNEGRRKGDLNILEGGEGEAGRGWNGWGLGGGVLLWY